MWVRFQRRIIEVGDVLTVSLGQVHGKRSRTAPKISSPLLALVSREAWARAGYLSPVGSDPAMRGSGVLGKLGISVVSRF